MKDAYTFDFIVSEKMNFPASRKLEESYTLFLNDAIDNEYKMTKVVEKAIIK